jgi:hypothetical protein
LAVGDLFARKAALNIGGMRPFVGILILFDLRSGQCAGVIMLVVK